MDTKRVIQIVETLTGGQATRIVVGGVPVVPGNTMQEKYNYMRTEGDWLRKAVCLEPRGHASMCGTLLTAPCTPGADIGALFFEACGWIPMCGCDTLSVCTVLVETGMVKVEEPYTYITVDTAAGLVKAKVLVENGYAKQVSFTNAPAFIMARDVEVEVPEYGKICMDISWGGNVYAIFPASAVGLEICPENANQFIDASIIIRKCINEQVKISHPLLDFVDEVTHIQFYGPPKTPGADVQNCMVAPGRNLDRSPCGTGTCAKSATLHAKGMLKTGESFVHESTFGSLFTCKVVGETDVCGIPAVYPEVSARPFIQAYTSMIINDDDPFKDGFQLG